MVFVRGLPAYAPEQHCPAKKAGETVKKNSIEIPVHTS
jgi:hypothetical protein